MPTRTLRTSVGVLYRSKLKNLQKLDLSRNRLTGVIPTTLSKLQTLKKLNVQNNILTGGFPNEICFLTKLAHLDVSRNDLEGFVPEEVGYMEQTREAGRRHGREVAATKVGQEPPAVRSATAAVAAPACPHDDHCERPAPSSAALLVSAAAILGLAVLAVAKAAKARRV